MLEINKLDQRELDLLLKEILHRVNRRKQAASALKSLVGSGIGVWGADLQQHIDALREEDRG